MRANLLPTLDETVTYQELLCDSDAASGFYFNISGVLVPCGSASSTDAGPVMSQVASSFVTSCASECQTGGYWGCVGQVHWPTPKASTCTIHFWVWDITGPPIPGATVDVYSPLDVNNVNPLETPQKQMTDANGRVLLTFDNASVGLGLNGFVHIAAPNYLPTNVYWGFPVVEASVLFSGHLVGTNGLNELASIGLAQDQTKGAINVGVADCRYAFAPGVQVTLSTGAEGGPAEPQGLSTTTYQPTMTTDATGHMLFLNVPVGLTEITATPPSKGKPSSQVIVYVAANTLTEVYMPPAPSP
jgi:hypothetical protein